MPHFCAPLAPPSSRQGRVIGFRLVDALATVSLKKSAVECDAPSYSALAPGMAISGTVVSVDKGVDGSAGVDAGRSSGGGVLVSCGPSVRARVSLLHASDAGTAKAAGKLKVRACVLGKEGGKEGKCLGSRGAATHERCRHRKGSREAPYVDICVCGEGGGKG
eukprot:356404-Chlamydomonas_euryale.AAC.2